MQIVKTPPGQKQILVESFGVKRLALEVDYANTILFDGLRQSVILVA
jgi:hypothetical protein